MRVMLLFAFAWLNMGMPAPEAPDLLDRIAVRVGKEVITESEVIDEIRMTAFLNQAPPDFNPASRRQAAERLVDQNLIRQEMAVSNYPPPEARQADRMLADLKKSRFPDDAQYRASLGKYGITEAQLKDALLWQLSALRFTDVRFGLIASQATPPPPPPAEGPAAEPAPEESSGRPQPKPDNQKKGILTAARRRRDTDSPPATSSASVDAQMDAWLKETRAHTSIEFFKEAFE